MADRTITAADSVLMLAVAGLFPAPQRLQGFMADRAFEANDVEVAETVRGVDGKLSAGWVPYDPIVTISLMPDSPSSDLFETWLEAERQQRVKLRCTLGITLPGTGRRYTGSRGVLQTLKIAPPALRVLGGRSFALKFDTLSPGPL